MAFGFPIPWAQADLRSVNGQIEYLLREAVRRRRGVGEAVRGSLTRQSAPNEPAPPAADPARASLEHC